MKRLFFSFFFIFTVFFIYAQESLPKDKLSLFVTLGPHGSLNTEDNSAPSPIQFSLGFGANINFTNLLSFSPFIQFYTNYSLWDSETEQVLPAEIEHRTALVFNGLIDLPLNFNFAVKNSEFAVGLGVGFLARIGILPQGVPTSEEDDVKNINNWFWGNLHFLYPMIQISWDYKLNNSWKAGLGVKAYYPISNISTGETSPFQNGMLSLLVRITFPSTFTNSK